MSLRYTGQHRPRQVTKRLQALPTYDTIVLPALPSLAEELLQQSVSATAYGTMQLSATGQYTHTS